MIVASFYPTPFDPVDNHDPNVAIISDGRIFAYEEDKLTTVKSDSSCKFAERAFFCGCAELNITPNNVDRWVFAKPSREISHDDMYWFFAKSIKAFLGDRAEFTQWYDERVTFVAHHLSHASLSVFSSGFRRCAYITADGGGDYGDPRCFSWGEFDGTNFVTKDSQLGFEGLGSFHNYVTEALGFGANENGKTSGLAAYGSVITELQTIFRSFLEVDGIKVRFKRERYGVSEPNPKRAKKFEYNREKIINTSPSDTNISRSILAYLPQDIAKTAEEVVHELFLGILQVVKNLTTHENVVFAGGLFLNVALNAKIEKSRLFKNHHFSMAPGDSGLALGAAFYEYAKHQRLILGKPMCPFLGPSYSSSDIEDLIAKFSLNAHKVDDPATIAAERIAAGEVVGWFQGRGEYGPRSLGNRSILADPRTNASKQRINQVLKRREWFMPYAPAILVEEFKAWTTCATSNSPYMQIAVDVAQQKKYLVPAAVHVDGTSRFQTVDRELNHDFWRLIKSFQDITQIPIVLNTSFNRHGIATISHPRQAIEHLLEGCIDTLIIDHFVVSFRENRINSKIGLQSIKSEHQLLIDMCLERLDYVKKYGNEAEIVRFTEYLALIK